ncbi:MAG: guanylate kinase [Myxococcota bacterium]|nr:guanylate kinase [Myxococcota bacterium]
MSLILNRWISPNIGALFVVTGPSGCGKTTLVHEALRSIPDLSFSISATTRSMRTGETHGKDYFFYSKTEFQHAIEGDEFLEWATVYDNFYGTPRKPIEKMLSEGKSIILDIDPQGAEQIRAKRPDCVSIFILPPSIEVLEKRLRARNTDSEEIIQGRMQQLRSHLQHCDSFDYLLINDDLPSAQDQFQAIIIATLLRREHRDNWVSKFQN